MPLIVEEELQRDLQELQDIELLLHVWLSTSQGIVVNKLLVAASKIALEIKREEHKQALTEFIEEINSSDQTLSFPIVDFNDEQYQFMSRLKQSINSCKPSECHTFDEEYPHANLPQQNTHQAIQQLSQRSEFAPQYQPPSSVYLYTPSITTNFSPQLDPTFDDPYAPVISTLDSSRYKPSAPLIENNENCNSNPQSMMTLKGMRDLLEQPKKLIEEFKEKERQKEEALQKKALESQNSGYFNKLPLSHLWKGSNKDSKNQNNRSWIKLPSWGSKMPKEEMPKPIDPAIQLTTSVKNFFTKLLTKTEKLINTLHSRADTLRRHQFRIQKLVAKLPEDEKNLKALKEQSEQITPDLKRFRALYPLEKNAKEKLEEAKEELKNQPKQQKQLCSHCQNNIHAERTEFGTYAELSFMGQSYGSNALSANSQQHVRIEACENPVTKIEEELNGYYREEKVIMNKHLELSYHNFVNLLDNKLQKINRRKNEAAKLFRQNKQFIQEDATALGFPKQPHEETDQYLQRVMTLKL